ncbi:unnamed protein product [Rotaria sp. Silwood1]|nr:unnamed protein product [Rotaria sp. Silwood1]
MREALVNGVASNILYNNSSIFNTSLLYLTALVNNQTMKVMIDIADSHTSIFVYVEVKLHITMGDIQASIGALIVKQLCTDCILGIDFINKYKLIINTEDQTISIFDSHTSIFVYVEVKLHITMGDIQASIGALIVKQLCTNCILGIDFINKYKLIINTEDQTISICENEKRTTLKIDINSNNVRFPTRLINNIKISSKRTISVHVSINLSSVNAHISTLIQHITNSEQNEKVKIVLLQNTKLFDISKPTIALTLKPHEIKTLDHSPSISKPYYSTLLKQEEMYKITQELLYFGLICS